MSVYCEHDWLTWLFDDPLEVEQSKGYQRFAIKSVTINWWLAINDKPHVHKLDN